MVPLPFLENTHITPVRGKTTVEGGVLEVFRAVRTIFVVAFFLSFFFCVCFFRKRFIQVIGKDATDDEHGRLCVVGEDDDEGDLVGGGGGLLPRPNAAAIGSRNGVATAAQAPSLLAMLLPPSGTKRRRKEMALAPFNAATAGEDAAAAAAAAAPGGVSLSGPLTATGAGGASGANSGGNAADKRPDGHRQRWKGYGGGGNGGASIAGSRAPPGVRGKVKGASGIGGSGGPGKEEALGSQSENRGEQEIELEFSRLKWALFRRRRQEVKGGGGRRPGVLRRDCGQSEEANVGCAMLGYRPER